jgi:hypothetical protein
VLRPRAGNCQHVLRKSFLGIAEVGQVCRAVPSHPSDCATKAFDELSAGFELLWLRRRLSQPTGRRRACHVHSKRMIWFGAMALVAGGSLVANMCAIHETSVLSATLNDRVLGFLPTRTRQAPGMERPRAGLASKFYTFIARVLGFLLSFNKKKI